MIVSPRDSESDEGASVRWLAAPASTEHDLVQVLGTVHRRLGRVDDDDDTDDALAGCASLGPVACKARG